MPELPDIVTYIKALERFVVGEPLERVRISGISLLGSYDPPIEAAEGKRVLGLRRLGKRIVFELEGDLFLVLHLMVAGRIRWKDRGATIPKRVGLAAFDFPHGTLLLTEASTRKRATLHLVKGEESLVDHSRGGLEVLDSTADEFADRLLSVSHTVKRALTDPRYFRAAPMLRLTVGAQRSPWIWGGQHEEGTQHSRRARDDRRDDPGGV